METDDIYAKIWWSLSEAEHIIERKSFKVHGSFFLVPVAGLLDSPLDTTQLSALIEENVLDSSSYKSSDSPTPEDGDSHPS
jgi:hypothetical protein